MRIQINHETRYTYETPARAINQVLRLTPRANDGQYIAKWRVDVDVDGRVWLGEDAFGNSIHTLSAEGPLASMTIAVHGEVETHDTAGVLQGAQERLPAEVFLRETPLTAINGALRDFARTATSGEADPLQRMHALLGAVHERVVFDTRRTTVATSAIDAFEMQRGVCQDLSHIFIACARQTGVPARYISGHLARIDGVVEQEASHAWAEALIPDLGWVGFDAANGICTGERHVRVAAGFDYLSAAPVRGARSGGGLERLSVRLNVSETAPPIRQSQG